LDVDDVEIEPILLDDAIDPLVTAVPDDMVCSRLLSRYLILRPGGHRPEARIRGVFLRVRRSLLAERRESPPARPHMPGQSLTKRPCIWNILLGVARIFSTEIQLFAIIQATEHLKMDRLTVPSGAKQATLERWPVLARHLFATRLLENDYAIRTVPELLGHKDVKTTIICTRVLNRGDEGGMSRVPQTVFEKRNKDVLYKIHIYPRLLRNIAKLV
jgi:hypothetical protein